MGRKIANALTGIALLGIVLLVVAYRFTYADRLIFGTLDEITRSEVFHATAWFAVIAVLLIVVGLVAVVWLALHPEPNARAAKPHRGKLPNHKTPDSEWTDRWD